MPGLGESRSARRALRSVSAAASGSPSVAWTGASAARRVELLGPGGASPGEDDRPLEPLARRLQVARGRVQLTGHRGGQRPHPVLLERLLGAQHVGGRHPRSAPSRSPAAKVAAARVPCARSTAMLLAPAWAIPTACSSTGTTSSDGAPRKCRAAPSVASATARQVESGRLSSSMASAPSASAEARSPAR